MKAEKRNEGGNFLKVKFVEEKEITELQIIGEVTEVEFTNDGKTTKKYQSEVTYEGQGKDDPSTWTMNSASSNALIDLISDETSDWKDKLLPITIDGQGEYKHFKIDRVRLKKQLKKD